MFEFFLDKAGELGSLWWLPLFLWLGYFFWCRSLDYPADLEKLIYKNKPWPYLPIFWKRRKLIRGASLLLCWGGNIIFACAVYSLFPIEHITLLVIGLVLAVFASKRIRTLATKDIIHLQQDRYFQIYTHMQNQALAKGAEVTDSELLAKAQWQHQDELRRADKLGRLMLFLKGEAKL